MQGLINFLQFSSIFLQGQIHFFAGSDPEPKQNALLLFMNIRFVQVMNMFAKLTQSYECGMNNFTNSFFCHPTLLVITIHNMRTVAYCPTQLKCFFHF